MADIWLYRSIKSSLSLPKAQPIEELIHGPRVSQDFICSYDFLIACIVNSEGVLGNLFLALRGEKLGLHMWFFLITSVFGFCIKDI